MIDDHEIIERMKVGIAMIFLAAVAATMFGLVAIAFYAIRIELAAEMGGFYGHIIWGFCGLIFTVTAGCGIHYAITRGKMETRTF